MIIHNNKGILVLDSSAMCEGDHDASIQDWIDRIRQKNKQLDEDVERKKQEILDGWNRAKKADPQLP